MQVTNAQFFKMLGLIAVFTLLIMMKAQVAFLSFDMRLAIKPEGQEPVLRVPQGYSTIQAAVDAAPPNAIIEVAPGVYSENLLLYKGVRLKGAGANQTEIKAARQGLPTILIVPSGASIFGFTITGAQGAFGIQIYGEAVASISHSVVVGNSRGGIRALGQGSTSIKESIIRDNGPYGIVLKHVGVPEMVGFSTTQIERNQISGHSEFGIFIINAYDVFIVSNILRDNKRGGIWMRNAHRINVLSNNISGSRGGAAISGDASVVPDSDYELIIVGNVLWDNQAGVDMLDGPTIVELRDNKIIANQQSGISMLGFVTEARMETVLKGNIVRDNGGYGVLVQSLSIVRECSKTLVSGNAWGDYVIYGSPPQPSPELKQKCEGS